MYHTEAINGRRDAAARTAEPTSGRRYEARRKLLNRSRSCQCSYSIFSSASAVHGSWAYWTSGTNPLCRCRHVTTIGKEFGKASRGFYYTVRERIWPCPRYARLTVPDLSIIFQTTSPVDLGFTKIILTEERAHHISTGHRDIGTLPNQLVKSAIEKPTHVYNSHIAGRYQFLSGNVQTRGGRPIVVIVERKAETGEIITATWKDRVNYPIIWDSDNGLYSNLDKGADILYVSRGPAVISYAVEDNDDPDIWYRYSDKDNGHTGITIFRVTRRQKTDVVRRIADFLGITEQQISQRINNLF